MIDQYRVLYECLTAAPTRDGRESGNAAAARGGCPMHHGDARIQPQEVR
jgi:hypothetical protein